MGEVEDIDGDLDDESFRNIKSGNKEFVSSLLINDILISY